MFYCTTINSEPCGQSSSDPDKVCFYFLFINTTEPISEGTQKFLVRPYPVISRSIYVGISTTSDTHLWVNHYLINMETSFSERSEMLLSSYIAFALFINSLCTHLSLVYFHLAIIIACRSQFHFLSDYFCVLIKFLSLNLFNKDKFPFLKNKV